MIFVFKVLGYTVSHKVLDSTKFGVAQCRERIIIVGVRDGKFEFSDMQESAPLTIRDILDEDGDFEYLDKSEMINTLPSAIMISF